MQVLHEGRGRRGVVLPRRRRGLPGGLRRRLLAGRGVLARGGAVLRGQVLADRGCARSGNRSGLARRGLRLVHSSVFRPLVDDLILACAHRGVVDGRQRRGPLGGVAGLDVGGLGVVRAVLGPGSISRGGIGRRGADGVISSVGAGIAGAVRIRAGAGVVTGHPRARDHRGTCHRTGSSGSGSAGPDGRTGGAPLRVLPRVPGTGLAADRPWGLRSGLRAMTIARRRTVARRSSGPRRPAGGAARIRLEGHRDGLPRLERLDQPAGGLGDVVGGLVEHQVAQQVEVRGDVGVHQRRGPRHGAGAVVLGGAARERPVEQRDQRRGVLEGGDLPGAVQTGVRGGLDADAEDVHAAGAGVDEDAVGVEELMAHAAAPRGLETGRRLADDRARRLGVHRTIGQQRRERRGGRHRVLHDRRRPVLGRTGRGGVGLLPGVVEHDDLPDGQQTGLLDEIGAAHRIGRLERGLAADDEQHHGLAGRDGAGAAPDGAVGHTGQRDPAPEGPPRVQCILLGVRAHGPSLSSSGGSMPVICVDHATRSPPLRDGAASGPGVASHRPAGAPPARAARDPPP